MLMEKEIINFLRVFFILDRGSSQAARRRPGRPERPPDGERHPHLGAQLWAVAAAEHGLDHDAVADRQEHDHQRLIQSKEDGR